MNQVMTITCHLRLQQMSNHIYMVSTHPLSAFPQAHHFTFIHSVKKEEEDVKIGVHDSGSIRKQGRSDESDQRESKRGM